MARTQKKQITSEAFCLPDAILYHDHSRTKQAFDEKSEPMYKVEVAIPDDDPALDELRDRLLDFAIDAFGEDVEDDPDLILPLLDGNTLAKRRERAGKEGSHYRNVIAIRASTIYNFCGDNDEGGIALYGMDAKPIPHIILAEDGRPELTQPAGIRSAHKGVFYPGCRVQVVVVMRSYRTARDEPAVTFYLQAMQKVGDGERLSIGGADYAGMFKARKPPRGGRSRDDQEDEDDRPGRRRSRDTDDRDEDDERPSRRSRRRDEDDEEDDQPRRRSRSRNEDDEGDEKPRRRTRSRNEDDEGDEKPRRRTRSRNEDDEEDDQPRRRMKGSYQRNRPDDDDEIPF